MVLTFIHQQGKLFMQKVITINETEHNIKKLSAHQVATIANILGKLSVEGRKAVKSLGGGSNEQFIWGVLASVSGEDLIRFAAALIGSDTKFAEENFDIGWVVEAVMVQMELSNINSLLTNFTSGSFPTRE